MLVEAGAARYAIEATSVVEVAPPDSDGESIRGFLMLKDLSELLGGEREVRPGLAVVLDVSPTLAIRIKRVIEVADVARAQFFMLPPGLGEASALLLRGCLLYNDSLYFELVAEALPHTVGATVIGAPMKPLYVQETTPDRALIVESANQLYGIPLHFVSQVTRTGPSYCPLPGRGGPVAGLLPHNQALWPVFSFPGLLGAKADRAELVVLSELAGRNVGIAAERVLGVHQNFTPAEARGSFKGSGMVAPALFLDLERMFS